MKAGINIAEPFTTNFSYFLRSGYFSYLGINAFPTDILVQTLHPFFLIANQNLSC